MNFKVKYNELELEAKSLLSFRKSFWNKVTKVVERGVIQNILDQQQADGTPLKQNAPSTIDRKQGRIRQARKLNRSSVTTKVKSQKEKKPKQNKAKGKRGSKLTVRSLIDQPASHRFIQRGGGSYHAVGYLQARGVRNFVGVRIGFSNAEAARTSLLVQGLGYVGWFGVSREVKDAISVLYLEQIEKALDRVAKRNNRKKPK